MSERQPQGKLNRQAYEAGKAARLAGKQRDLCPNYQRRSLVADWERGWDEAVVVPEVVVRVQEAVVIERAPVRPDTYWPKDRPLPDTYQRQRRISPCPQCGRRLLDDGSQVTVLKAIHGQIAYLRCRQPGCHYEWKLRVEEA
jgi:ribosome modulation factor